MQQTYLSSSTNKNGASGSRWRQRFNGWLPAILLFFVFTLCILPLFPLIGSWNDIEAGLWQHLWQTELPQLFTNTILLIVLVGSASFLLGVGLAWLVVMYDFPGRGILQWGLMLPLAIPPYILAFVVLGFTDFGGPMQHALNTIGLGIEWLPDMRSPFGVSLVFTLSLYPYVYLLMRSALQRKGRSSYESARTLGYGKIAAFWKLVLPLTRPAWVAGLALVLMETLADFGAVSIFNFNTFTTAVYKSWYGFYSQNTAAQLACLLLLFVTLAVLAEKWGRGQGRYEQSGAALKQYRQKLTGGWGVFAQVLAWSVFSLGFILPVIQLIVWSVSSFERHTEGTLNLLVNTVTLAVLAALLTLMIAAIVVWAQRQKNSKPRAVMGEFSQLGYAMPGTVLAVGLMMALNIIDGWIADIVNEKGQWLATGLFALLLAYVIRFLRIGFGPLSSSMGQIKPSIIETAGILGAGKRERLFRVYIPLLRPGVLTALLLVFVEVMKEMPATLILRTYGWDTLAIRIYELSSEGEWELTALPAIMLVAVGIIPVILLIKKSEL
ncbi:ABC transporter permease [Kangiella sediminilitoris]|uniref:ABC transporter permease n=1 Tax=Kangiella sediminilitoris TaxID=1144748 RepID=A0A1B3B7Y2_9GAMM|nr:iron ABC transporter permease [Kangiella sediminilitoris]AOE48887.1 ABC transporter permease [Kangiella sediminilitoris]